MDYTKLDYFDAVFCPHCGKLLKSHSYSRPVCSLAFGSDEYPDYDCWETFNCKDCKIKASTKDYKLDDIRAWKFPKDYKPTITQKQINYIKYLGDYFWKIIRYTPVITNKELASEWIGQFVELLENDKRKELYDEAIKEVFKKSGYTKYNGWIDQKTGQKLIQYHKVYNMASHMKTNTISVELTFDAVTKEVISNLKIDSNTGNLLDLKNTISNIDDEINYIRKQVKEVIYPDEQAGKDQVEKEKQEAKKYYENRYDYDDSYDGPWCGAFGEGDLC